MKPLEGNCNCSSSRHNARAECTYSVTEENWGYWHGPEASPYGEGNVANKVIGVETEGRRNNETCYSTASLQLRFWSNGVSVHILPVSYQKKNKSNVKIPFLFVSNALQAQFICEKRKYGVVSAHIIIDQALVTSTQRFQYIQTATYL